MTGETKKYLVSIVIPCFNAERFISEAIESCLNQTYKNIEIIVVNDGSTDSSYKIINSYGDKIVKIEQENKGGSAARNTGLNIAKGDFVLFLDADDFLEHRGIERHMIHMPDNQTTENTAFYGDYHLVDESGKVTKQISQPNIKSDLTGLKSLIESALITGSLLYKTYNVKSVCGFNERLRSGQEYDLNIRLFLTGVRFVHHNSIVFNHRNFNSSTRISCRRWPEKEPYFIWELMDQYEKMLPGHYLDSIPIKAAIAVKLASAGKALAHSGNIDLAVQHFKRAFTTSPECKLSIKKRYWTTTCYIFLSRVAGIRFSAKVYRRFSVLWRYFH